MYRLDVSKLELHSNYSICISKDGQPVEDHICITDAQAGYLADESDKLARGGESSIPPNLDVTIGRSGKHGNAYQLIIQVSDTYLKVYILTEIELKLFVASLKRAIDG